MKTAVNVYISSFDSSANFENKVAKIINEKLMEYGQEPAQVIELEDAGIAHKGGRGQYSEFINLRVDGCDHSVSKHSTDSQTYDRFSDNDYPSVSYNNFYKRFILFLLPSVVETLVEEIMENRDNNNE